MDNGINSPLWKHFDSFLTPSTDRHNALLSLLHETGISASVKKPSVNLDGGRYLVVSSKSLDKKRTVLLIAHYDRITGSPGANDNAAAVFILAETAIKLLLGGVRDWIVIFTDKEELAKNGTIREQGSFTLAHALRQSGFRKNPCFIFDTVGRGDTVVISTTAKHLLREKAVWSAASLEMRRAVEDLNYRALEAARRASLVKFMLLPTPFSDDAGFFMAGFPAQTITVLPEAEAARFQALIRAKPALLKTLLTNKKDAADGIPYPETWRLINGPEDTANTLTPANFALVGNFAESLCKK